MLPPIVPAREGRLERSSQKAKPLFGRSADERLNYTALALADKVQPTATLRVLYKHTQGRALCRQGLQQQNNNLSIA
jgi:hypothetical protein